MAAGVRRMVRALGRRIGDEDPVDLLELVELREVVDQALRDAVKAQHDGGYSWGQIAAGLGTSRQAVFARFGQRDAS